MKGMLLAAGFGTRFRPFTQTIPKPAIPLLNVPIAYYNMHLMQQVGVGELVVNTHYLEKQVEDLFSDCNLISMPVHFSHEKKEILGTGGAVHYAWKFLKGSGTIMLANADVVNGFAVHDAFEFHCAENPLATMVVIKHREAGKKYGAVWVDKQNQVIDISKKKPDAECEPFHFVGLHFFEERIAKFFPAGKCDINTDVYLQAIKKGEKILAFEKQGLWFDAGTLDDFLAATRGLLDLLPRLQHQPFFLSLFRRFWKGFEHRPHIWEGEDCEHLLALGSAIPILLGNRCRVHPSAKITGFAVLGDGVTVEQDAVLENVVVMPSVNVAKGQTFRNTLVV